MRFKKILMILLLVLFFSISLTSCGFVSNIIENIGNDSNDVSGDNNSIFTNSMAKGGYNVTCRGLRIDGWNGDLCRTSFGDSGVPYVMCDTTIGELYSNVEHEVAKPDSTMYQLEYILVGKSDVYYSMDTPITKDLAYSNGDIEIYFYYKRIGKIDVNLTIGYVNNTNNGYTNSTTSTIEVEVGQKLTDFLKNNNKNNELFDKERYSIKYVQKELYWLNGLSWEYTGVDCFGNEVDYHDRTTYIVLGENYAFDSNDECEIKYTDSNCEIYTSYAIQIFLAEKTNNK